MTHDAGAASSARSDGCDAAVYRAPDHSATCFAARQRVGPPAPRHTSSMRAAPAVIPHHAGSMIYNRSLRRDHLIAAPRLPVIVGEHVKSTSREIAGVAYGGMAATPRGDRRSHLAAKAPAAEPADPPGCASRRRRSLRRLTRVSPASTATCAPWSRDAAAVTHARGRALSSIGARATDHGAALPFAFRGAFSTPGHDHEQQRTNDSPRNALATLHLPKRSRGRGPNFHERGRRHATLPEGPYQKTIAVCRAHAPLSRAAAAWIDDDLVVSGPISGSSPSTAPTRADARDFASRWCRATWCSRGTDHIRPLTNSPLRRQGASAHPTPA
jgi:hypothetical protein